MVAKLIDKNCYYYCSECNMRQHAPLAAWCSFCGAIFTNYEEILTKIYKDSEDIDYD